MSSVGYHEPIDELSDEVRDMHRAIVSLMEELEAIDWYNQRAAACKDPELKSILEHNRDEEKEHAAMVLEWIRRQDPVLDKELKDYLFTTKTIAPPAGGCASSRHRCSSTPTSATKPTVNCRCCSATPTCGCSRTPNGTRPRDSW